MASKDSNFIPKRNSPRVQALRVIFQTMVNSIVHLMSRFSTRILNAILAALSSSLIFLIPAYAAETLTLEQHPAIQNPVWLKDAVQIRITPRGQKLFSEGLMQIISNLGLVINENYFPAFDYVMEKPISIDELAKKQPDEFKMLLQVRQFFKQYLQGIEFKDFRPSIQIADSEYVADFNKLSLVTDADLMEKLGKKDGAVLSIEMSIRNLRAKTDGIKVQDLENPWIGQIGVVRPEVTLGSKEAPLVARMPFYVRVDENGLLEFEALKIEENLDRVPIEIKYRRIVLPEFEFKVVGQSQNFRIKLNEDEFKKIVDEHLPDGLRLIRKYVRDFLQNDLPRTLNEKAQEALKTELEQIQPLPAPGNQTGDPRPPFSLGLKLAKLNLVERNNWYLALSAFIEDTSLALATPFWERSGARSAPVFNHLDPSQYDLAVAIDRAVFNRAIHLAANRKNFKRLETCPGQPAIELLSAPAVDFNANINPQSDLEAPLSVFIDASVEVPEEYRKYLGLPVLKEKLRLKMKYQALIKPTEAGGAKLSIYPTGVDLKTLQIDSDSLRGIGKLFAGRVRSEIEKILSSESSCGNSGALAEFELIKSLWGIPLEFAKIRMDSNGQLMLDRKSVV